MSDSHTPSSSFKIVHWIAIVLLFLMMVQPTFDNVRALLTGVMGSGDVSIDVTFSQMILHIVAMAMGWLGLWWFSQRQKRGAYLSIAAHVLGMIAVVTQTPDMMAVIPRPVIAVFFVILLAITIGPTQAYKDAYS